MQTEMGITKTQSEIHEPIQILLSRFQFHYGSKKRSTGATEFALGKICHGTDSYTQTHHKMSPNAQQKFEKDSQHTQKPQSKLLKLLVRRKGRKSVT